jgi:hypothetical protein
MPTTLIVDVVGRLEAVEEWRGDFWQAAFVQLAN